MDISIGWTNLAKWVRFDHKRKLEIAVMKHLEGLRGLGAVGALIFAGYSLSCFFRGVIAGSLIRTEKYIANLTDGECGLYLTMHK